MIVRSHPHSDGRQGWLLIPQQEHALLAWKLAAAWIPLGHFGDVAALEAAIRHHDDGWSDWDAAPGVDSGTGEPRDFLNMELPDALAIWRKSIERAADFGPLCQYAVSAHFSALLDHSRAREQPSTRSSAEMFLQEEEHRRSRTLSSWLQGGSGRSTDAADWAVRTLQFFDRFSLVLCCGYEDREIELRLPDDSTMRMIPEVAGLHAPNASEDLSSSAGDADPLSTVRVFRLGIFPWQWNVAELGVVVRGRWLPIGRYSQAADVVAAMESSQTLRWQLTP